MEKLITSFACSLMQKLTIQFGGKLFEIWKEKEMLYFSYKILNVTFPL